MKKERTPRNGEEKNTKEWRMKKLQGMKKEKTPRDGEGNINIYIFNLLFI